MVIRSQNAEHTDVFATRGADGHMLSDHARGASGRMIRGTGVARALGRVLASRDAPSSATVYRESVLLAAATFTAKTNRCPSWLMFPRFPPIGPGSLNSSLGVPALNVGMVVTSTDMTSSSLDSRF